MVTSEVGTVVATAEATAGATEEEMVGGERVEEARV